MSQSPRHPLEETTKWLHPVDFAVLAHGWAPHGRDYMVIVEASISSDPGQHEITLTHCVRLEYETRVRDGVLQKSWTDEFTDYKTWQEAGEPEGYVWGTEWSMAYQGLTAIEDSELAREWTERLQRPMFELTLETDRFFLKAIFHSVRSRKLNDSTSLVSRVIIPLSGGDRTSPRE